MNFIDLLLNKFTMYRVVLYGLLILSLYSFALSFLRILSFSPLSLVVTFLSLSVVCFVSNLLFAKILKVTINSESSLITGIILYFILWPYEKPSDLLIFLAAGFFAMASKYLIAYKGKHLFNPAAISAVLLVFLNSGAIWWVATPSMLPLVIIVGLLFVRKIRRFSMFLTFLAVSFLTFTAFTLVKGKNIADEITLFFYSFPVVFLGTVMLTEPLTTPPTRKLQVIYASIVGYIFSLQTPLGHFYPTPEAALLAGNLFSFALSPKYRLELKLLDKFTTAKDTLELVFEKPKDFHFKSGQYLEWTAPLTRPDGRGNRRYFTIASSPTEDVLRLGVKLNFPSSVFKQFIEKMDKNSRITAGSLAGDFTLEHAKNKKAVFIAGGIGITPFRSMIKKLMDERSDLEVTLFYSNKIVEEIAYQNLLGEASQKIKLKVVYVLTDVEKAPKNFNGEKGRITKETIKKHINDINGTAFFLSGPIAMVNAYKKILKESGVKSKDIVTDYFPGF